MKIHKFIALLLIGALFSSTLNPLWAQNNLWAERHAAAQEKKQSPKPFLELAGLSGTSGVGSWSAPAGGEWVPGALSALHEQSLDKNSRPVFRQLPESLKRLPAALGQVGGVYVDADPASPVVLLVQDAHQMVSAQKNIRALLDYLTALYPRLKIGFEGTSGAYDFERYRALKNKRALELAANMLLDKSFINGAEHFGLTAKNLPQFWGVEDEALYFQNVQAYRRGLEALPKLLPQLAQAEKQLADLSRKILTPEQVAAYQARQDYEKQKIGLPEYLAALSELHNAAVEQKLQGLEMTQKFLRVCATEKKLDMPAVERQRVGLLRFLSARLSSAEINDLAALSAAWRAEQVSVGDFYRRLRSAMARAGLRRENYAQFHAYVDYVFEMDAIRPPQLYAEIAELNHFLTPALAQTPEQTQALSILSDLAMVQSMVRNQFGPLQWKNYLARRAEFMDLPARLQRLSGETSALKASDFAERLEIFERFYEAAQKRENQMVERLLKSLSGSSEPAVLIAGGFHTENLEEALKRRGVSYLSWTPKLNVVAAADSTRYLDFFSGAPTPVEKMLLGDRLLMNPISAFVQHPPAEFSREIGVVLELLKRLYVAASHVAPADAEAQAKTLWENFQKVFGQTLDVKQDLERFGGTRIDRFPAYDRRPATTVITTYLPGERQLDTIHYAMVERELKDHPSPLPAMVFNTQPSLRVTIVSRAIYVPTQVDGAVRSAFLEMKKLEDLFMAYVQGAEFFVDEVLKFLREEHVGSTLEENLQRLPALVYLLERAKALFESSLDNMHDSAWAHALVRLHAAFNAAALQRNVAPLSSWYAVERGKTQAGFRRVDTKTQLQNLKIINEGSLYWVSDHLPSWKDIPGADSNRPIVEFRVYESSTHRAVVGETQQRVFYEYIYPKDDPIPKNHWGPLPGWAEVSFVNQRQTPLDTRLRLGLGQSDEKTISRSPTSSAEVSVNDSQLPLPNLYDECQTVSDLRDQEVYLRKEKDVQEVRVLTKQYYRSGEFLISSVDHDSDGFMVVHENRGKFKYRGVSVYGIASDRAVLHVRQIALSDTRHPNSVDPNFNGTDAPTFEMDEWADASILAPPGARIYFNDSKNSHSSEEHPESVFALDTSHPSKIRVFILRETYPEPGVSQGFWEELDVREQGIWQTYTQTYALTIFHHPTTSPEAKQALSDYLVQHLNKKVDLLAENAKNIERPYNVFGRIITSTRYYLQLMKDAKEGGLLCCLLGPLVCPCIYCFDGGTNTLLMPYQPLHYYRAEVWVEGFSRMRLPQQFVYHLPLLLQEFVHLTDSRTTRYIGQHPQLPPHIKAHTLLAWEATAQAFRGACQTSWVRAIEAMRRYFVYANYRHPHTRQTKQIPALAPDLFDEKKMDEFFASPAPAYDPYSGNIKGTLSDYLLPAPEAPLIALLKLVANVDHLTAAALLENDWKWDAWSDEDRKQVLPILQFASTALAGDDLLRQWISPQQLRELELQTMQLLRAAQFNDPQQSGYSFGARAGHLALLLATADHQLPAFSGVLSGMVEELLRKKSPENWGYKQVVFRAQRSLALAALQRGDVKNAGPVLVDLRRGKVKDSDYLAKAVASEGPVYLLLDRDTDLQTAFHSCPQLRIRWGAGRAYGYTSSELAASGVIYNNKLSVERFREKYQIAPNPALLVMTPDVSDFDFFGVPQNSVNVLIWAVSGVSVVLKSDEAQSFARNQIVYDQQH